MSRALDRLAPGPGSGSAPGRLPLWAQGVLALPAHLVARLGGRGRLALVVLGSIIALHALLTLSSDDYAARTSLSTLSTHLAPAAAEAAGGLVPDAYYAPPAPDPDAWARAPRANGALVMLARNGDVQGAVNAVRRLEDRWNRRRNYPWVFLNDDDFSDEFKTRVSLMTESNVTFGRIQKDEWVQPASIDEARATEARQKLSEISFVPYADSIPYRNMCRYNSGFFYRHPLLASYKWYWRVEPDVDFTCDIQFDPFLYMQDHNKTYGFTISLIEFVETIPTLWDATKEFMKKHPEHVAPNNALNFISDDGGEQYNMCHFWSNFEIADLDFWRGPAYSDYFDFLDAKGGFYYERWGDAPVHSLAAALFLPKSALHWFEPIGYEHAPHNHCPREPAFADNHCQCGPEHSFDDRPDSCLAKYKQQVGVAEGAAWRR